MLTHPSSLGFRILLGGRLTRERPSRDRPEYDADERRWGGFGVSVLLSSRLTTCGGASQVRSKWPGRSPRQMFFHSPSLQLFAGQFQTPPGRTRSDYLNAPETHHPPSAPASPSPATASRPRAAPGISDAARRCSTLLGDAARRSTLDAARRCPSHGSEGKTARLGILVRGLAR